MDQRKEKAARLAAQLMQLARDSILVQLRFLDVALSRLRPEAIPEYNGVATNMESLFYDPVYVLQRYREEENYGARLYLHVLLHCIFYHGFSYGKLKPAFWDLAADIAVEHTILEMDLPFTKEQKDLEEREVLAALQAEVGTLTAERIYRYFKLYPPSSERYQQWHWLFARDSHELWKPKQQEETVMTQEMWKKISERVKAELKSFSRGKSNADSLEANLAEATRDRYDYGELLRRFTVMGEDVAVNEEEFDYIYYTYGLSHYGNMPLIEPLEYREENKVREFVIVLDTSASCRGSLVRSFLKKTCSILKGTENFFRQVNIHIIQCDSEVRSDTKITSEEELTAYLQNVRIEGFGSTDFVPAFSYVEELRQQGEFDNLKGLIYFTDGYGVYPERMPAYDVIFAFVREDDRQPEVPAWAIRVLLEEEELE